VRPFGSDGMIERLRHFIAARQQLRMQKPNGGIPSPLISTWLLSCIVGPAIGWLVTSNVIGSMTPENWKILCAVRLFLSLIIPGGSLAIILLFYVFPTLDLKFYLIVFFLVPVTLPGYFAGTDQLRDLLAGEPQVIDTMVVEVQRRGEWDTPWHDRVSPRYGPYRARLKDGQILDFYCTPVCLDWPEGPYRNSNLMREDVRITYLPHMREILEVAKR
jgi:hypothetical protein